MNLRPLTPFGAETLALYGQMAMQLTAASVAPPALERYDGSPAAIVADLRYGWTVHSVAGMHRVPVDHVRQVKAVLL